MSLTVWVLSFKWMSSHCIHFLILSIYRILIIFIHIDTGVFIALTHSVKSFGTWICHTLLISLFSPIKKMAIPKSFMCLHVTQISYEPATHRNLNVDVWIYIQNMYLLSFPRYDSKSVFKFSHLHQNLVHAISRVHSFVNIIV